MTPRPRACVLARYEVVPEQHARVTAPDEHPENDVKPAARGARRPGVDI